MRHVLVEVQRIDDADSREGQALLARDVGQFVDRAQPQRMRCSLEHARLARAPAAADGLDRTIADALACDFDFDQWLEPDHAARTDAHDLDGLACRLGGLLQRQRGLVGTQCQRRGVARYKYTHAHWRDLHCCTSSSKRSAVTRP